MIIEKACDATSNKLFEVLELTGNGRSGHKCCVGHARTFSAGVDILHEGQEGASTYLLCDGWTCSYRMLRDGTRQIIGFQVPGDILDLHTFFFHRPDRNVQSVSKVRAAPLVMRDVGSETEEEAYLKAAARNAIICNEAVMTERIISLGRRDAAERIAHLLLECWVRLRRVRLCGLREYKCPLSQYHLADALGLSAVHVNRVLKELRNQGVLTFRKGVVRFDDFENLLELADFNPRYLDADRELVNETLETMRTVALVRYGSK